MNKLPKKLSQKKLSFLVSLLLLSSLLLGFSVSSVWAQSCDEIDSPEFHSLRPYPASPCDQEISETALFCGNNLVIQEKVSASEGSCILGADGKRECTVTKSRLIAIDLSDAELPIVGNTEDVLNSSNKQDDSDLNDAEKVNEYVSWYLNGVINRAEDPFLDPFDDTDISKIIDFSGPLKKLLPWDIQAESRIKTIERAIGKDINEDGKIGEDINEDGKTETEDRHDQVVACTFSIPVRLFGSLEIARLAEVPIPCYSDGLISFFTEILDFKREKRLSDWKDRLPPLIKDYESLTDYQIAYKRWRGERCAVAEIPSFIPVVGGKKFFYCFDDPTKPNFWANLFPYIPFSSTEDRVGSVETKSTGVRALSEGVEITDVSFEEQEPAELFFAHMEETTELARMLQQTFVSKDGAIDDLTTTNVSPSKSEGCDLVNIRTNSGDNLFAGELSGVLTYTAKFTCDADSACEQAGGKCYDTSNCSGVNQVTVNGGAGCSGTQICCSGGEACSKDVVVNLSLVTKTPKAVDELWARTTAGAAAIFKKIFPKVGSGGAILGILDIPAATKVSYSGENVSAGNPSSERSGESAELYFPHIGGVSEYFLKGIQTILRPKGFGEQIISGQASASVACGQGIPKLPSSKSACSACPDSYIDLPPSMREIFESAGSYYNVPASVLFAIFYNEGAWDRYNWTEDLVVNSSGPNCEVPNCSSYSSTSGATGPFSFISNHWEGYKDAVLEAGINDGREPNVCNLLDTAFAAAKKLAKERGGGVYDDPICAGLTMNQLKGPSSSCSWSDADIVTAARQYLGYCEDPEHPDPVYKPRPSCVSNPVTCYQKNVLEVSRCRY